MEANQCPARADLNFGDLRDKGVLLNLDKFKQILRGFGNWAKAIRHFRSEAFDVLTLFEFVYAALQRHADRQVGDIVVRNEVGRVDGDLRRESAPRFRQSLRASACFQYRFFQHRLI